MAPTSQAELTPSVEFTQKWLELAPKPPPRGDKKYDTFISYRSSDRRWAMTLYDALKLAGWDAFLDQYELVPGAALKASLNKALTASSSGVILWSSRTKDSEWCERERDAMTTLKDHSNGAFHFIFAKLDEEPLPLLDQRELYVDFADSPEGPRGVNLLRLICGMSGEALPEGAVKLAQEVDDDAQRSMIQINGAIEAGNAEKLVRIGTSMQPGVLASPGPILAVAQGLISLDANENAREVIQRALSLFPQSIRAKQLDGLALRRLKKYQEAIDVLTELKAAGHQDAETLGILAAARDGLYFQTGREIHLHNARELYRTAFQADPGSYYAGVNAASKSLFLGEADEAARLLAQVLPLVAEATDGKDLWAGCTLGEVYLLQRKIEDAAEQFQRVIDNHPNKIGDLKAAAFQAQRICKALGVSADETASIVRRFALLDG